MKNRGRSSRRAQTLVEFALIFPLFILLLTAVIEFALVFNALLAINFASRDASLVAAEAGSNLDADCLILASLERSIGAPANAALITKVRIYRFNNQIPQPPPAPPSTLFSEFTRTGSTSCPKADGTSTVVPYSPVPGAQGYTPADRCNRLAGCNGTTVIDQIGVEITYRYESHTPLGSFFTSNGRVVLVKGNVMRMEPVL